jgi:hypothetical protein
MHREASTPSTLGVSSTPVVAKKVVNAVYGRVCLFASTIKWLKPAAE